MFLFGYLGPFRANLLVPPDCHLPVIDLTNKKAVITGKSGKPKAHVRPLPPKSPDDLEFNIWLLAHAVKKAECAIPMPIGAANVSALGFVLENSHLLNWTGGNFRLADQAIGTLDDFSQSALAGRIGQGCCLLFMESLDYTTVSRFSSYCSNANPPIRLTHTVLNKKGKPVSVLQPTPDFVCEKSSGDRAIAESKGGFVTANKLADVKGALRDGLEQIGTWGDKFNPKITQNYAVCTFLREQSDTHVEPSLLAWVDPEGTEGAHEVPKENVWRENYAAWLEGMGYPRLSARLRGDKTPVFADFEVAEIGGHKVAVRSIGFYKFSDGTGAEVAVGLRLDVLWDLHNGRKPAVLENGRWRSELGPDRGVFGSFLTDGSYLGLVHTWTHWMRMEF